MATTPNYTQLSKYIGAIDSNNQELKKGFVFNETGNIMMATTDMENPIIEADVQKCFAEVSVFFAAMTRAVERAAVSGMTGVDRDGNSYNYSMYDYESMKKIIDSHRKTIDRLSEGDCTTHGKTLLMQRKSHR